MTQDTQTNRQDLIDQFAIAAELEHGLCLQYLFTASSLKDSLEEGGMTLAELNVVRKWKANIFFIAAQEMLHLMQVSNIVSALGSGINLNRPNFPQRPNYYPTDLPWGLWPFSDNSLVLYALYERPESLKGNLPDWLKTKYAMVLQEAEENKDPFHFLPKRFSRPKTCSFETIGQLYANISKGLLNYPTRLVIGDERAQINGNKVDLPQLEQIFNRQQAIDAIGLIVEQGEGAPKDRQDSHFGLFSQIYHEYQQMKRARTEFNPVRDVQANPLSHLHVDNTFPGWRIIHDPFTRQVNNLNSHIYRLMLQMIYQLCTDVAISDEKRTLLVTSFLRIMTTVIKPLCELLTHLPMGDDGSPGEKDRPKFAGPSFEMVRQLDVFPNTEVAFSVFSELLDEYAQQAVSLLAVRSNVQVLESVAKNLGGLSLGLKEGIPSIN